MTVTGDRELIQQALLRLTIKKGSFKEDPSLGSELYKLYELRGGDHTRIAQSYVQEALLPMPEVEVTSVRLERESGSIRLFSNLSIKQNQYQLEVDVN